MQIYFSQFLGWHSWKGVPKDIMISSFIRQQKTHENASLKTKTKKWWTFPYAITLIVDCRMVGEELDKLFFPAKIYAFLFIFRPIWGFLASIYAVQVTRFFHNFPIFWQEITILPKDEIRILFFCFFFFFFFHV